MTDGQAQTTVQRAVLVGLVALGLGVSGSSAAPPVYRMDRVTDGDTVVHRNGQRVRLVQIDTPEVFFEVECYGRAASRQTSECTAARANGRGCVFGLGCTYGGYVTLTCPSGASKRSTSNISVQGIGSVSKNEKLIWSGGSFADVPLS